MSDREATPPSYPPARHFMRDLRVVFERRDGVREMRVPLVPELLSDAGTLDLGVATTLLDMLGGGDAVAAAQPDWAVTSDITAHLAGGVRGGVLVGTSRVLRAGRNTMVLEARIAAEGDARPVALAHLGFTRVLRRDDTPRFLAEPPARTEFGGAGDGFEAPWYAQLGVREVDARAGVLDCPVADYQRNSLRAMQGGVVVGLAAKAGEMAARAHAGLPLVACDVAAHYLAMSKIGPIRSAVEILRATADTAVARVELRDTGYEDRLCVVAIVGVAPAPEALR
ncbi:MAG: hypothetical protein KC560_00480 [Myxococcales bacterium]|nr:hypothetical protein [Myxococcales bacterium]